MSKKFLLPLGILVIALGVVAFSSLFTVHQTQQAIVLQFGAIKRVVSEPGLSFKLPFIQDVRFVERRVLNFDPEPERVILADQRPLIVDSFSRYRIVDPNIYIQRVSSERALLDRLGPIVNDTVRAVFGDVTLSSVLSEERADLMNQVRDRVNNAAQDFGIEMVDVRIGRADLAPDVSESVYNRMRAERERDAAEFRAQGQEQYDRITSAAEREATVIIAEARRESEILRGQGEGERTTILSDAYGQDAGFFQFYRSMEAYRESFDGDNAYMVLSTDSDFFRYFDNVTQDLDLREGDSSSGVSSGSSSGGSGGSD
ncbi:MAG: protease modulator HflC [Rhodovibrionaceae bacterium]